MGERNTKYVFVGQLHHLCNVMDYNTNGDGKTPTEDERFTTERCFMTLNPDWIFHPIGHSVICVMSLGTSRIYLIDKYHKDLVNVKIRNYLKQFSDKNMFDDPMPRITYHQVQDDSKVKNIEAEIVATNQDSTIIHMADGVAWFEKHFPIMGAATGKHIANVLKQQQQMRMMATMQEDIDEDEDNGGGGISLQ